MKVTIEMSHVKFNATLRRLHVAAEILRQFSDKLPQDGRLFQEHPKILADHLEELQQAIATGE